MPNHVHVLFNPLGAKTLSDIIKSWKQFSAKEINRRENTSGKFWQSNYWDRLIRSQEHFDWTKQYIQNNPKNLKSGSYPLWRGDL